LKSDFENGSQFIQSQTSLVKKSLMPVWNQSFEFNLSFHPEFDMLFVSLVASKAFGEKIIGRIEIPLTLVVAKPNESFDCWFKLLETKGKNDTKTPGSLRIVMK